MIWMLLVYLHGTFFCETEEGVMGNDKMNYKLEAGWQLVYWRR
jgi:hypothetical protein